MIMYNILIILFRVGNIFSLSLLVISYVLTIIAKKRKSILATTIIVFPVLSEQHSLVKRLFWSGTLFAFLNWLLCSSFAIDSNQNISHELMIYGFIWAIVVFVGISSEVIIKCIKTNDSNNYSVICGVKSSLYYATLYFILSFLTA